MEEASSAAPEMVGTWSVLPSDMDAMVRALKNGGKYTRDRL